MRSPPRSSAFRKSGTPRRGRGAAHAAAALLFALVWSAVPVAAAEPGVHPDRILFGQSAAFEGPAAALGRGMRHGILAAFGEINRAGGVAGRRLELVSYDDAYEPETAIENTERLIRQDQVFALIGEVGTPTSRAVQPIATAREIPFIAPFTGASFLREPRLANVVNIRATYDQETEAIVDYATTKLGLTRIAILYQDDSFGLAGLKGVRAALVRRGLALAAEGAYMRNTTAVKTALLQIRKIGCQTKDRHHFRSDRDVEPILGCWANAHSDASRVFGPAI